MSGQRWRVYVENFQSGWVEVSAPDEQTARDRAQKVVAREKWYPEQEYAHTADALRKEPA